MNGLSLSRLPAHALLSVVSLSAPRSLRLSVLLNNRRVAESAENDLQGDISQESRLVYSSDVHKLEPRWSLAAATRRTADDADKRGYHEVEK